MASLGRGGDQIWSRSSKEIVVDIDEQCRCDIVRVLLPKGRNGYSYDQGGVNH